MPVYKVASLKAEGKDVVIVPVEASFVQGDHAELEAKIAELQSQAFKADLKGLIALVWADGERMAYLAPQPLHSIFRRLSMAIVESGINAELSW